MAIQDSGDEIFFTASMAQVLEGQGLLDDALFIYKMLADKSPGDTGLKKKIEELKELARARRRPGRRTS